MSQPAIFEPYCRECARIYVNCILKYTGKSLKNSNKNGVKMGNKSTGFNDQWIDHKAKSKSRAKKSVEKLEEKLKGKRMIPDPVRKGCYIYVDAEEDDAERKRLSLAGGECFSSDHNVVIVVHHPKPKPQEDDSVEMGLGVDVKDVVDELDHVQKFGPSFGAYPVIGSHATPIRMKVSVEWFEKVTKGFSDIVKGLSDIMSMMASTTSEFEKSMRLLKDLHVVKEKKPTYKSRLKNLVKNYRKKETHFTGK